jgi:hypothetical protein
MKALDEDTYLIFSRQGISATHPIIIKDVGSHFAVCSVASKDGTSKFDYSLVVKKKDMPENGTDDELIEALCYSEHLEAAKKGWEFAMEMGIKAETVQRVVSKHLELKE